MGAGYLVFCALYLFAGYVHLVSPTELAPTAADRAIAYLPEAIWVYLSQFAFLFVALYFFGDDDGRTYAFWGYLAATAMAFVIFMAWPTSLPRPAIESTGITAFLWRGLYATDTAANYFPSLHVALAGLAAARMAASGGAARVVGPLWALAITASTLLTRQHVLLDVAGGAAIGAASWVLVRRLDVR